MDGKVVILFCVEKWYFQRTNKLKGKIYRHREEKDILRPAKKTVT